ncbi:MAG: caspase family protein [Reichenbachiella sp.]|uniref:caspase family protein n=1 Tax=Reichenbachiella sp. TaxID=2184521 RepID=UPI0032657F3A
MKRFFLWTILIFLISNLVIAQVREKRLALVIGNSNYEHEDVLHNAVNDAKLIGSTLETKSIGFKVLYLFDGKKEDMQNKFREFIELSSSYDVLLFYYAGHGIEVEGLQYLIPVDKSAGTRITALTDYFNIGSVINLPLVVG